MTAKEFQATYSAELKDFFESPCGKAFLDTIRGMRPGLIPVQHEHLLIENAGAVRGYEQCLKNIIILSILSPPFEEIQLTYGVKDERKSESESKPQT